MNQIDTSQAIETSLAPPPETPERKFHQKEKKESEAQGEKTTRWCGQTVSDLRSLMEII